MGSVTETVKEVVDYLREKEGKKVGLVIVHLYRPFSHEHLFKVLPTTVKRIAVLDRTKEQGAAGEPLYLDVRNAFYARENPPVIIGGRYGLSSKDTDPGQIFAVYENLEKAENAKNNFTIGIIDDVTHLSLDVTKDIDTSGEGVTQLIFYGLGSDGTVGANKNTVKLIGENTDYYAQAYFAYDSKSRAASREAICVSVKTRSVLRISLKERTSYRARSTLTAKYDMLRDLKEAADSCLTRLSARKN